MSPSSRFTPRASSRGVSTAVVAVLGAASLGITATAAYAAWNVSGSATGTAKSASALPLAVTVTSPVGLYPGAIKSVIVGITNPNEFPVVVKTVTLSATASSKAACTLSNVITRSFTGTMPTINPSQQTNVTISDGVELITSASNDCQGVTFDVSASVTAASPG